MGQGENKNGNNTGSLNKGAGARSVNSQTPAMNIRGDGARASGTRPPHSPKK